MIIWLIGLSGSGKSTLGHALYECLKPQTRHLVYLDGDDFREIFCNDVDHTIEGRRKNAERISHFCRVLDQQGIHVVASVLSIFPEWQKWNRDTFSSYFEIFLDIPMNILEARDTKGLYEGARTGRIPNVVGIDIPFPTPARPDLTIDHIIQTKGVDISLKEIFKNLPAFD